MNAKEERKRLQYELMRFSHYFVEVRKAPIPEKLSEHCAELGFTKEDEMLISRAACQLHQRCAVGRFAERILEDVLAAGEEHQELGEAILSQLHGFLEEYIDLLKQEYAWCKYSGPSCEENAPCLENPLDLW